MSETPNFSSDAKTIAKVLRDGGYSYNQSRRVFKEARRLVGLKPKRRRRGSVERLSEEEAERFIHAAYEMSGKWGLAMRVLLELGLRVSEFVKLRVEDIAFRERLVRVVGKGGRAGEIPVLPSLTRELRVYLGDRQTGFLFPSPRGGHYSARRIQQVVKDVADEAEIHKRVHPHKLRHTTATLLVNAGMPMEQVQKFLRHENIETTQRIYADVQTATVRRGFEDAMKRIRGID